MKRWIWFLTASALVIYSLPALDGGSREVQLGEQIARLLGEFFPPDLSILPETVKALGETIRIATLATLFAVLLSIPLSIFASLAMPSTTIRTLTRLSLSLIRTIPSLVWAVIIVALIGPSTRAGVFALTFYSIGYLGKFFTETLDQADARPAIWLRTQGANAFQSFRYAYWPELRGTLGSQSLWMWEYNIRSAAIIGYVGAGGLGLQLHIYQEFGQWNRFCTVLILIFALVVTLEFASSRLKTWSKQNRGH